MSLMTAAVHDMSGQNIFLKHRVTISKLTQLNHLSTNALQKSHLIQLWTVKNSPLLPDCEWGHGKKPWQNTWISKNDLLYNNLIIWKIFTKYVYVFKNRIQNVFCYWIFYTSYDGIFAASKDNHLKDTHPSVPQLQKILTLNEYLPCS